MLRHGFFGIFLHPRVDGGVDAQAVAVEVILRAVGLAVLVEPSVEGILPPGEGIGAIIFHLRVTGTLGFRRVHKFAEHIAKIGSVTGVMVLLPVGHHDGDLRDRVEFGFREIVRPPHLLEHVVAAGQRLLRVQRGIVARRLVDHTHEASPLLDRQFRRVLGEEGIGGGLDAIGIAAEEDLVEIHRHDLLLRVVALDLDGGDPFLQLDADHLDLASARDLAAHVLTGIEGLGELLGDRTAAALRRVAHQQGLHRHAAQAAEVDAGMPVEARVFRGDRRIDDMFRNLVVTHIGAVLNMIGIDHLAVFGDQQGRQVAVGILDLLEGRNLGKESHQQQRKDHTDHRKGDDDPEPLGYFFL